jgi:hypothetical protein
LHLLLRASSTGESDSGGALVRGSGGGHAENPGGAPSKSSTSRSREDKDPSGERHHKMMEHVLRGLAGFVCSALEHEQDQSIGRGGRDVAARGEEEGEEDDGDGNDDPYTSPSASHLYRASHVAAFAVESLLRIDTCYSRQRPTVLPPLWKCIDEIVSSWTRDSSNSTAVISPTVVRRAVRELLSYLNEGTDSLLRGTAVFAVDVLAESERGSSSTVGGHTTTPQQQLTRQQCSSWVLQSKVLSFLLARLATFLPLVAAQSATPSSGGDWGGGLVECFRTLARLRCALLEVQERLAAAPSAGKRAGDSNSSASSGHNSINLGKACAQLASKVECAVANRVLVVAPHPRDGQGGQWRSLDATALEYLLAMETASLTAVETAAASDRPGRSPSPLRWAEGQALLLVRVLESVTPSATTATNLELSLRIVHSLVFDVLPAVQVLSAAPPSRATGGAVSGLVARFLAAASACLLRCETEAPCLAALRSAEPGQARFHGWLLSWLAPSPSGIDNHPLSTELALSLLHLHTADLLRPNHAAMCEEPSGARGGVPMVGLAVGLLFHPLTENGFRRLLACFLTRLINDDDDSTDYCGSSVGCLVSQLVRPHARALERSLRGPKKRKRTSPSERLRPMDLEIVLWLLSRVSLDVDDVPNEMDMELASSLKPTGKAAAEQQHAAFRASLSRKVGTLRTSAGAMDDLQLSSCLASFTKAWNDQNLRPASPIVNRSLHVLGMRVFERVRTRCEGLQPGVSLDSPLVDHICRGLSQVLLQHNQRVKDRPCEGVALLTAIRALSSVGRGVSVNNAQQALLEIARGINQILLSSQWTIRTFCLSSVISFAQALPEAQRGVVVRSIPETCHELLSCRKQNVLLVSFGDLEMARSLFMARSFGVHQRRWKRRRQTSSTRPLFKKWSSRTSTVVEPGSYLMIMPTQEGRQAIVIFQPCPESLRDIRFMIGICDDDEPMTQSTLPTVMQVQAFASTSDGCCKMITHQAEM